MKKLICIFCCFNFYFLINWVINCHQYPNSTSQEISMLVPQLKLGNLQLEFLTLSLAQILIFSQLSTLFFILILFSILLFTFNWEITFITTFLSFLLGPIFLFLFLFLFSTLLFTLALFSGSSFYQEISFSSKFLAFLFTPNFYSSVLHFTFGLCFLGSSV